MTFHNCHTSINPEKDEFEVKWKPWKLNQEFLNETFLDLHDSFDFEAKNYNVPGESIRSPNSETKVIIGEQWCEWQKIGPENFGPDG